MPSCRRKEGRVNKQDLVAKIAKDAEMSKTSASAVVESFIDGITSALKKGEAIKIPKRRVVRFSAGTALKKAVR